MPLLFCHGHPLVSAADSTMTEAEQWLLKLWKADNPTEKKNVRKAAWLAARPDVIGDFATVDEKRGTSAGSSRNNTATTVVKSSDVARTIRLSNRRRVALAVLYEGCGFGTAGTSVNSQPSSFKLHRYCKSQT